MKKKNIDQQTGITKDDLLSILEQSNRPGFTKRFLTQLTHEGLLPSLQRTTRADSNHPCYVWEQGVIEQAKYLYDVRARGAAHSQILLALWLAEFDVPFEPLLQQWLAPINTLLHNLTGGELDSEDALCHISSVLVMYEEPRWKFSPRPDDLIRKVGIHDWRDFMEFLLDMLAVPTYEPDETASEGVRGTLQKINTIAQTNVDPDEALSEVLVLREIFTLPRYRDALLNATIEKWLHVRDDYLTFCQLLHQLAELFPKRNALLTEEMRQALFLKGGALLLPLLLAIRYASYGDRIDEVLDGFSDMLDTLLADSDVCQRLAAM